MKVIPLIFSITSGAHTRACSHSDSQLYASGSIRSLNIGPDYQYSQNHTGITEKDHGR